MYTRLAVVADAWITAMSPPTRVRVHRLTLFTVDAKLQLRRSKALERFRVHKVVRQELASEAVSRQVDDDVLRGTHKRGLEEHCQCAAARPANVLAIDPAPHAQLF